MVGRATRLLPYALAFFSSLCIMTLELVSSRLVARHVGASLDGLDQRDRDHPGRHLPGQRAGRPPGRPRRAAPGGRAALRARVVPDAVHAVDERLGRLSACRAAWPSRGSCGRSWSSASTSWCRRRCWGWSGRSSPRWPSSRRERPAARSATSTSGARSARSSARSSAVSC